MNKTVCELFAGVGGFRCGLNNIKTVEDTKKEEKWETVWFSQWEPSEKTTQYAHSCYIHRFGTCLDLEGKDTTNCNIEEVNKKNIPDFNFYIMPSVSNWAVTYKQTWDALFEKVEKE